MEKLYDFYRKYGSIAKSFVLCLATMNLLLFDLKVGYIGFAIFDGILCASWFVIGILELSLKWEETENENNDKSTYER